MNKLQIIAHTLFGAQLSPSGPDPKAHYRLTAERDPQSDCRSPMLFKLVLFYLVEQGLITDFE
jgi:hypothetical protein